MHMLSYKGFTYEPIIERDDDVEKIFHDVITISGKRISADFSPYAMMNEYEFKAWIDLGCPKRIGKGPLTAHDLKSMVITLASLTALK